MIDAKEAVRIATKYFQEVFAGQPVQNLLLEELEKTDDGKSWRVTLGFDRVDPGDFRSLIGKNPRYYKVVTLNAMSGDPESVKIRAI